MSYLWIDYKFPTVKIALTNQRKNFKARLESLKQVPVRPYEKSRLREKISSIEISTALSLEYLDLSAFFDYRIFPEYILLAYPQWRDEKRSMQPGDTILQQVYLPPVPGFSQKVLFGVRIKEIVRGEKHAGFSYETLEGHVECGISWFILEEIENRVIFSIHTFSKPGNLLTRLLGPVFSLPYQTYCTNKALKQVKEMVENAH